ncbi:MAG: murein biosynthesis integral membrane protein MurJ, partial [Bacteriovoracaceae bacterium]
FQITVTLTRILSPFLVFVSLAALFMGVLNSLKVFFVPALAPACYNLVSVLSMLLLTSLLYTWGYPGIYSLGIGALLGAFTQAFVQLPLLWRRGFRPVWPKKLFTTKSKKVFKLLGPGLIGFAATQINMLIITILATGTVAGAVSWLSYSFRLFQLPVGILSVSIGNSNLIHFSQGWKAGNKENALDALKTSYFLSFVTIMPAMIILYFFSEQIVNLIFERGRFTADDTSMTSLALRMYALGLPFYGLYKIWVPVFYALERQRIPVIGSILSIVINIGFCLIFTPKWGFSTLALGTSLSVLINSFFLGFIIKKELGLNWDFFINLKVIKIFLVSILASGLAYYLSSFNYLDQILLMKALNLFLQASAVIFLYGTCLFILGERSVVQGIWAKLLKKMKL